MDLVSLEILDTKEPESCREELAGPPILLPVGATDVVLKESALAAGAPCEGAQPGGVSSISAVTPCVVEIAPSFPSGDAGADADALPVEEAPELVQIAPFFFLRDATVDASAPSVDGAAEVVEIAPSFSPRDAAADTDALPVYELLVEETAEIAEIAPFFFFRDAAIDSNELLVEEAAEVAEIAPLFPSGDAGADADAPSVEEAAEVVEFAPSFPFGDAGADADALPVGEAAEVAEIAPLFPSCDAAADTEVLVVEEPLEAVEVAPSFPVGDTAAGTDAFWVEAAAEIAEIAPLFPSGDAAADTDALPVYELLVEETAELAEIALSFSSGDAAADTEVLRVEEVAEVAEIAPSFPSGDAAVDTDALPVEEAAEEEVPQSLPDRCVKAEAPLPSFLSFYGLGEQPFGVTPDPAYLYPSAAHREALESLSHGIQNLRGFMVLAAEPGMGKTTLLNKLMEELGDSTRTVFFFQTQCNSREFFRYLLNELGVASAGMDLVAMHRALNEILFQEMLQGRRFVLIVDEAQNLHDSVLETIRLLSDFETTHTKLLQIILAGQPQLVDKLMRPNLSQLRQRIAILTSLKPLDAAETAHYIEHRLSAAGSRGQLVFTPDALALIAERSHGIPRNINNICSNALMLGYSERCETIDSSIVQKVAAKLDLESLVQRPLPSAVASKRAPVTVADSSSQLLRNVLAALAGEAQPDAAPVRGIEAKAGIEMTGKLTELVRCRHRGKDGEFRIQVSLERECSSEMPVADRYYCCIFFIGEEQANSLRVGQTIRIKIDQD